MQDHGVGIGPLLAGEFLEGLSPKPLRSGAVRCHRSAVATLLRKLCTRVR